MLVNAVAPWEGQLVWVGTPNGGYSQTNGQEWKSVDFTLKYQDHQMQEQHITFSAFGVDKVDKLLATPLGTTVRVTWSPDTRESRGQDGSVKWWPKLSAFGITVPQSQPGQQPVYPQQQFQQQAPQQYPPQGTPMPPQALVYQQPAQRGYPAQQPVQQAPVQNSAWNQLISPDEDLPI